MSKSEKLVIVENLNEEQYQLKNIEEIEEKIENIRNRKKTI